MVLLGVASWFLGLGFSWNLQYIKELVLGGDFVRYCCQQVCACKDADFWSLH